MDANILKTLEMRDVPAYFIDSVIPPGNYDYFRIEEWRYMDMIHLVLPGDRSFICVRAREAGIEGFLVKIEDYRRNEVNFLIVKVKCL